MCNGSVPGNGELHRYIMHELQWRPLCSLDGIIELHVMPSWDEVKLLSLKMSM
jgi:hypothetical protein